MDRTDAISHTLAPKRFDGRVITSMRYKRDGTLKLRRHPSARDKEQLFVVAAEGGEPRQLTTLDFEPRDIEWSPNGQWLYFAGDEKEDDEQNRDYTMDIYAIPPEGGEPRLLTANPGTERSVHRGRRRDEATCIGEIERGGSVTAPLPSDR